MTTTSATALSELRYRLWMRTLRALVSVLLRLGYRLRIEGAGHVPREGGVLVVSNHTAFHDWMFVGAALARPPRFVMHQHHFQYPALRAFFGASRVIPIAPRKEDPARLDEALEAIDAALARGELVVIFPEGTMSPDGRLSPIRPGFERIVARRPVPVVPVAVEGLFGSWLSRAHGAPMSGRPRRFRAPVTVRFGAPLPAERVDVPTLRARLAALSGQSVASPGELAAASGPA
jgi:1-acyl-sn-glycerol-3-phosphate acyltransferase